MMTEEKAISEVEAISQGEGVGAKGFGIFGQVVAGLKGEGFSPIAIWTMAKLILELIEEYGPKVGEIIDRIKEIFKKS